MTRRLLILAALLPLACAPKVRTSDDPDPPGAGAGGHGGKPTMTGGTGGMTPPETAPPSTSAIPDCKGDELPGPRRLRLLTRDEYANTVADLLGIPKPSVDNLPVESVVDGFDNNAAASAVTSRHLDEYLSTGERLAAAALAQSKARLLGCQPTTAGCDRTFVTAFGRRALRRPLADAEVTRFLALFNPQVTGNSFDKGMELVLRAMLASPSFLYRSEVGEKAADGSYKLTGYEVATALSYFFWETTPDDALLEAARTGALDRQEGVEAQAKRLLGDPRSRPAVASFFRQWLGTSGFQFTNKDLAVYPDFSDPVRNAMIAEEDAFVGAVVFGGGKFADLFQADYVFANDVLAPFYGLPAVAGPMPQRVPAGENRGGLLTLGAVVGMHAHSNESSPVRRGAFVRTRLLCQTLQPPPQNLNIMPPGLDATLTTRERFAKHASEPLCKTCHALIDDLGFGFERYDGVGAYRDTEAGQPIDASGIVRGLEDLNAATATKFDGPLELGRILAKSPNAQACLARQLFRFARGGESARDACAIRKLQAAFTAGGLDLQRLLLDTVEQKSFLTRTGP
ncbi:MAG TPA: DUF1592 domain-containing protein [Polyangia bacterium]|nr:DUF1592 domain-containing protein [Polyangia bacterium]